MVTCSMLVLAQAETTFHEPSYFAPVMLGMLVLGAMVWLIAAVLGFARAKAFGASTRWFSFAAVSLFLFHVQFIVLGIGVLQKDSTVIYGILSFFNFFIIVAAICSIMGFIRLTHPR